MPLVGVISVSGVTHMCSGNGQPDPPHPACPPTPNNTAATTTTDATSSSTSTSTSWTYPSTSRWSGYRFHEKDPLWFEGGVQLLVRNGDVGGPVSYGSAKCYNVRGAGSQLQQARPTFWSPWEHGAWRIGNGMPVSLLLLVLTLLLAAVLCSVVLLLLVWVSLPLRLPYCVDYCMLCA
eukprot:COSAG06_NODE_5703_length_3313_cov_2.301805_2_plen_178_part_00